MTQNKQYIEQHKNFEDCGPCPVFAGFYPGIYLTTEEKAQKKPVRPEQRYEECVIQNTLKGPYKTKQDVVASDDAV